MYFEVLDSIINVIEDRFDPRSFQAYLQMESLLLKPLDRACAKSEIEFLNEDYGDEIITDLLEPELEIWETIFNDSNRFVSKIFVKIDHYPPTSQTIWLTLSNVVSTALYNMGHNGRKCITAF